MPVALLPPHPGDSIATGQCHPHRRPPSPTMLTTATTPSLPSSFLHRLPSPYPVRRRRSAVAPACPLVPAAGLPQPDHTTLPFLSFSRPSTHPSPPPCSVSWSTAGSALPPPTSPRPPSLIVVNVVRPGFPARGLPKAATFPRLTGSASPVLGSAATGEALSPPASHPPAEITSPAPFSTRVEPSRTFSELSPRREFHPATVDGVSRTTVYSRHPPLLAVTAEDQHPPRSPAVWPPAASVIAGRQPPFLACRCIPPRQA